MRWKLVTVSEEEWGLVDGQESVTLTSFLHKIE